MIQARDLKKNFGPKTAVDGISFTVERGEVLGFLGPNGAGKSTTMRMARSRNSKPRRRTSIARSPKRDFFKIEGPSGITLDGTADAQKWKLTRDTVSADWKRAGAAATEKVDQPKVSQIASAFAYPAFTDVLKIGKETGGNQPVTVAVSAQFAKERTPAKDEKPEDRTRLDAEFKARLKKLEDKLAAEKKFEGRPFLIAKPSLDQITKDRAALLDERKPEPAPNIALQTTGGAPLVPGAPSPNPAALAGKAPPTPTMPQALITVTTPPIAIPPKPAETPKAPAKPKSPLTATTPPVTLPPPAERAKPKETPHIA